MAIRKYCKNLATRDSCKHNRRRHISREWFKRNRDKQRAYAKGWRKAHPIKSSRQSRRSWLWERFELTEEAYDEINRLQKGKCAICGKPEIIKKNGKVPKLGVDHSHKTGKSRGLLCHKCNVGLGHFMDSPKLLKSAIEYLGVYQ